MTSFSLKKLKKKKKKGALKQRTLLYLQPFKIQDSRFKIQDSRFKIQDSRFKIQELEFGN